MYLHRSYNEDYLKHYRNLSVSNQVHFETETKLIRFVRPLKSHYRNSEGYGADWFLSIIRGKIKERFSV